MKTEQIMALADKYQATAPNVNWYRQQLQSAIEQLVQEEAWRIERDAYQREADKLVAENKALRDGIQVYQTQLGKDTVESDLDTLVRQGAEVAELKVENKTLRDALAEAKMVASTGQRYVDENKTLRDALQALINADAPDYIKSSLWDNARAALKWSDYEPN